MNPFDSESIGAGIKRIVNDSELRQKLRIQAIKRSGEFSWERAAELTWDVISVASGSGTNAKSRDAKVLEGGSVTAAPDRTLG